MFGNVLIGLGVMMICLFVQALLVAVSVQFYARHQSVDVAASFTSTVLLIGCVMMVLVLGNFVQITIWGALFVYLGEFESYRLAAYHSAVNFATLGYGDIVMSEQHRILGPMQAINGVLMVGVSTAVMMSTLQDSLRRTVAH
ncbi:MAG: ion channel [Halioglobus sp.]